MALFDAALHESAHSVVALHLGFRLRELKVWEFSPGIFRGHARLDLTGSESAPTPSQPSASPPDGAAGVLLSTLGEEARDVLAEGFRELIPANRAMDYLTVSTSGRVAQARLIGEAAARAGAEDDIELEWLLLSLGVVPEFYAKRDAVGLASRRAAALLDQYWNEVMAVALQLAARGRLDGAEVEAIIGVAPKGQAA